MREEDVHKLVDDGFDRVLVSPALPLPLPLPLPGQPNQLVPQLTPGLSPAQRDMIGTAMYWETQFPNLVEKHY